MLNYKRLIICCAVGYMEDRVRLNKLKLSLAKKSFEFWGWIRSKDEKRTVDYPYKHLLTGGGYNNKRLAIYYPLSVISYFFNFLFLKRGTVLYVVGFDTALPAYCANIFNHRFQYIFDNPDNFSLTYNLKGGIKKIVEWFEDRIAKRAVYHILPGRSRFTEKYGNEMFVPNFPMESQYQKALEIRETAQLNPIYKTIVKDTRLKVYINGRMVKERGSQWIANIIQELPEDQFLFVIVGRIDCSILSNIVNNAKNVIRINRVPNEEALAIYLMTDIVLAFYDPALLINRKAEPNKWGDCVKTKTAFISNEEIETLEYFNKKDACFSIPYENNNALKELLLSLDEDRNCIEIKRKNLSKIQVLDWEQMIIKMLK